MNIKAKVQAEIDSVLGDRPPTLDDRGKLVFTEATIMEIQRLGSIAGMAVPHRALEDIHVRGYRIPKDTMIWSILYYIMRDPDYWSDPDSFKPERFIGEDGHILKEERFVPFGIGKHKTNNSPFSFKISGRRICIGETLAKTELFIIFTRLFQMFSFESCEGHTKPTDDPYFAFIVSPKPFYCKAVPRS